MLYIRQVFLVSTLVMACISVCFIDNPKHPIHYIALGLIFITLVICAHGV